MLKVDIRNIERKRTKEVKMNRISLSDRDRFVPKEGEVFFAEVPGKGIDRKRESRENSYLQK